MPTEIIYRRAELYEQVWAEPMRDVAKRYGVSDVALAKTCRKLKIPLPGRGYWARVRAGGKPRRLPLRKLPAGGREELAVRRAPPEPNAPEVAAAIANEERPESAIVVRDVLRDPHELVARAARFLKRATQYGGLLSRGRESCLNIAVAPTSLDRSLRIMDALLRAFETRGLRTEVADVPKSRVRGGWSDPRPNETRVLVDGVGVPFGLFERCDWHEKRAGRPPTESRYERSECVPTGELELRILRSDQSGTRRVWRDGNTQRLESCLNKFVAHVYVHAEQIRNAQIEAERWHAAVQEAQRERADQEQQARGEAQRIKQLQEWLTSWKQARDIRAFVAEVRTMVADAQLQFVKGHALDENLKWAAEYADGIDPLTPLRQDIEVARSTFAGQAQRSTTDTEPPRSTC